MSKTPNKKKSKAKPEYKVVELPPDNADMEAYVELNRAEINQRIVDNIEYAIKTRIPAVEMFCFKGSSFIVVLNSATFKENLQAVFDYEIEKENYELCARVQRVISEIDKLGYVFTCNKTKKT